MPIAVEHLVAHRGEPRPPTGFAAFSGLDNWLGEATIHRVHEQPGPLVTHPEPPPGGRDRSCLANTLQEVGLSRTNRDFVFQHNAKTKSGTERSRFHFSSMCGHW